MEFRDISAAAFEKFARRQVDRVFEGVPLDAAVLPVIGDAWPFQHCDRATQKQVAVTALCALRWFETEAPIWAQPLLLKAEECYPLLNNHPCGRHRRAFLRGSYGMHARSMSWNIERMTPFELFCAYQLLPAPSPV
jgi:hypothetical protein